MGMSEAESFLVRGTQLYERICAQTLATESTAQRPSQLTLSFDLFCILVEYTVLIDRLNSGMASTIEELFSSDDLLFDAGSVQLVVGVDFFLPQNTIIVR